MINADGVINYANGENAHFFKIYQPNVSDKNACFSYWIDEADDQEKMLAKLSSSLDLLQPGKYLIVVRKKADDNKNDRQTVFVVGAEKQLYQAPAISGTPTSFAEFYDKLEQVRKEERSNIDDRVSAAVHTAMLEDRLKALEKANIKQQEEINALNKERHEYGKEKLALISNGITGCQNIISGIFQKQPAAQIAGVDGADQTAPAADEVELDDNDKARFVDVIQALRKIEPTKWLDLLEGVVRVYKESPTHYQAARAFLIKDK